MNYLIFSDTHGDRQEFEAILHRYQHDPEIAAIFYNGDSEFDDSDPIWQGIHTVLGNMDFYDGYPIENVYKNQKDDIIIYQTHGHLARVADGLQMLDELAEKQQANIVLFGHTHVVFTGEYDHKLFINPGSTTYPRGPRREIGGTYVILTVSAKKFVVRYFARDFQEIASLQQTFKR
ncbi:YfcE family phosphodiesterase [Oenococcus sicerae]|uniref:YfcE family phosphodiesterase n=1 Tax=Oenococcus sicerae TaxID=2203724 RepID=UPI0039E81DF0